jgi:DnaJ-class molecular chaperone
VTKNTDPPFPADESEKCPKCEGNGGRFTYNEYEGTHWKECRRCDGHGVIHKKPKP